MKTAVSQNGRVSKSVNVYTSEPGAKNLRLRFTVDVRMPIAATPSFRFVLNTIEGQDASQRILLRRTDGEPLEIRRTKVPLKREAKLTEISEVVMFFALSTYLNGEAIPVSGGKTMRL